MRVLLKNIETGLFYAGQENWTDEIADAIDFHRTDAAMDAVYESRLANIEVVMRFEEPFLEIPMSIVGFGR